MKASARLCLGLALGLLTTVVSTHTHTTHAASDAEAVSQIAEDRGDGYAINFIVYTDGTRESVGDAYQISPPPVPREAYAQAAHELGAMLPAPLTSQAAIIAYIQEAALRDGVPVAWALRIAKCESGYNANAIGPMTRTGSAKGVMQFMDATFARMPEGRAGKSVFDARANIDAAMHLYQLEGARPWECV